MRISVWCSAALALLAVASALRTTQGEGAIRTGRRLAAPPSPNESPAEDSPAQEPQPTFRPRGSRRREDVPPRDVVRPRTRSRPSAKTEAATEAPTSPRNERFDSRRTHSRTRNRTESSTIATPSSRDNVVRSRSRTNVRRTTTTTSTSTTTTTSTTPIPEVSSPAIDESKIEVINSNFDDLARSTPPEEKTVDPNNQFRRRSSTTQTTETVVPRKLRGRVNTRPNARSLDLDIAGTTNTLTTADKEPTTIRTGDSRNSRKLRYKTRLSETDTNLTGEGMKTLSEVIKSSQDENENVASQPEVQPSAPVVDNSIQQSTEGLPIKETTLKVIKMMKRPLTRGHIRSSVPVHKKRTSDEINEDDNYPESFKALIQAKNASTQTSSPTSESLSVKASQKVFNTYTASSQSTNTGTVTNKYSRFRSKAGALKESKKENKEESFTEGSSSESPKPRTVEFKPRGTFTPRRQKSTYSPAGTSTPSSVSSEKPQYKFSRKFKITTTQAPLTGNATKPKRTESNVLLKKSLARSTYQRKSYPKKNVTTESSVNAKSNEHNDVTVKPLRGKSNLPRTSYYSRSRNNKNVATSTTTESTEEVVSDKNIANKKSEDTVDMPLIFTLLKNPVNVDFSSEKSQQPNKEEDKEMFIIAVTSKESQENNVMNEVTNTSEESENNPVFNTSPTTVKYHANYKDLNATTLDSKEQVLSSTITPVKNIQTRKYSRKRTKAYDHYEDLEAPKPREKGLRKFSESFSKTTDASTNGINPESEKPKSRFSAKYRAPNIDKPAYKPTVPTITPSTAWLKFFVTDQLLTKSVEEPNWFDGDDTRDVTTESMSRQPITTPPIIHVSSIELVEGEEIDLGPDMNAISFTKTRSTLSSADLRLSESLVKSSHVMNVEASHHSPSVTVSIFDALADILTSTPRSRLSSTTEVSKNQYTTNDVLLTFNGVSNNNNVNSVGGLSSQDTLLTTIAGINTNAKPVQNTDQTTPLVNNRLSVGEGVTPSLSTNEGYVDSVNTIQPVTTPIPTTPISARKPFAIKILYSDTELPDRIMTSTEPTFVQPSTDPTMVYNTVSDILLPNNNLVSSELTSMLANNIKSIIENLDESSRSRVTSDMAELLKSLIPRAIDGLATVVKDVDIIPNTTPYTLEDIKDTENVVINNDNSFDISSFNILQNETVNSTVNNVASTVINANDGDQAVNSPGTTLKTSSTTSASNNQVTPSSIQSTFNNIQPTTESLFETSSETVPPTFSDLFGTDADTGNSEILDRSSVVPSIGNLSRIPFLTNFMAGDFIGNKTENNTFSTRTQAAPLTTVPATSAQDIYNLDVDDPSQISRFQLWVLSKKARVLKMIEDLIRQHNDELATVTPLTEILDQSNNIPLSDRLTRIMNTMTSSTTETTDLNLDNDLTSPMTTPFNFVSLSPSTESSVTYGRTSINFEDGNNIGDTSTIEFNKASTPISTSVTVNEKSSEATIGITEQAQIDISNRLKDQLSTTTSTASEQKTTEGNTETTTASASTETTTQSNIDTTMDENFETSTSSEVESTTATPLNQTKQNIVSQIEVSVAGQSAVPKKDYVIFGILPNNTVVRKDPNDDVLESLTEATPYIVYGVLPNNTVIRRFPNGTRVPRVMQKIDILPISPWSLRNPYSPIHNNPAIVRPQSNPIRVSTNIVTSTDTSNNGTESRLTSDTVNNLQMMISSSALNIKDSSSLGITTAKNKPPTETSTASHVLSLRTTTMLPSIDEILLNSISSAAKEEMVISSMTSSTSEPRVLTLDIDPETKQIRTEKPGDGTGNAVFKFIPIDEVTVAPQNTNVLKLASPKVPSTMSTEKAEVQTMSTMTITEMNTQTPQIQTRIEVPSDPTTTSSVELVTPFSANIETTFLPSYTGTVGETTTEVTTTPPPSTTLAPITTSTEATTTTTTPAPTTTTTTTTTEATTTANTPPAPTTTEATTISTTTTARATTQVPTTDGTTFFPFTTPTITTTRGAKQYQQDAQLLQQLLKGAVPNIEGNVRISSRLQTTTTARSIEDDIRQFEEDTKLLKALLQATGQNPANFNIPTLNIKQLTTTTSASTTTVPTTTTTTPRPTTTRPTTTTQSIDDDIKKLQEDTKLLQALLQATGQNTDNFNIPIITGVTSNVRIASNPLTTSLGSNPTTPINIRPVYQSRVTTPPSPLFTFAPRNVFNTLQTTTEGGISTTLLPFNQRRKLPTTTARSVESSTSLTGRQAPGSRFTTTTDMPSTSTFSVQEDLAFLNNLKSVLKNNVNNEDPEASLANRIIALAVERSLNEIQSTQQNSDRFGKAIANNAVNAIPTTTTTTSTTTSTTTTTTTTTQRPTTTTSRPTTTVTNTPSLEDDIKQFQEDTKLLQALLKATGQDPSKFNIPTLPNLTPTTQVSANPTKTDLKLLSNLLATPSPLNEPFDSITMKLNTRTNKQTENKTDKTSAKPFGAKIAVKDNLKSVQDDEKLLKTLIKLQDVQETTTQKNKLAITGQTSDEALKKLLQNQQKPKATGMMSEATQAPMSLSTEFGKSNDALLAALLKEQGFGPTTASSLDEQLRLSALLNQVVVTPKARRTTTHPPPPPPPPPRRPILDGLAWLWQQWRETAPGPAPARPSRPAPSSGPTISSSASTSNRVNWFGSGPFVGNADDRPTSNRVPLDPPRAVTSEQTPGRGQLVSAAINVTRAFSQFLGAAIQGAAQTVQNVIRAGQRAASDVYVNGSGGSG